MMIADIDADRESDRLRCPAVALRHGALHDHRAGYRIDGAGELDEYVVAGGFDDTAPHARRWRDRPLCDGALLRR